MKNKRGLGKKGTRSRKQQEEKQRKKRTNGEEKRILPGVGILTTLPDYLFKGYELATLVVNLTLCR